MKSEPHIICGYEHITYDLICVLPNNHTEDHEFISLEEYLLKPEREKNNG